MRHTEEYYICDRCGERIKDVPRHLKYATIFYRKPIKIESRTVEPFVYSAEDETKAFEVGSMEIVIGYNTRSKEYDLCPKCRKEFERFMKNEYERG